jgi:hypothetical protein
VQKGPRRDCRTKGIIRVKSQSPYGTRLSSPAAPETANAHDDLPLIRVRLAIVFVCSPSNQRVPSVRFLHIPVRRDHPNRDAPEKPFGVAASADSRLIESFFGGLNAQSGGPELSTSKCQVALWRLCTGRSSQGRASREPTDCHRNQPLMRIEHNAVIFGMGSLLEACLAESFGVVKVTGV